METYNFLFKNKEKIDSLRNYLYNNNLTLEEIDKRLYEFSKYFYLKGVDHGSNLEKETQEKIKNFIKKKRNKIFNDIFNKILNKK
jgi:hypothetical protein